MSDWSGFWGRPQVGMCAHKNSITTVTAGLERSVCEDCGHVSVRFVAETVKIFPDYQDLTARVETSLESERQPMCGKCDTPAVFLIPRGLACAEHAWAAASRQDALGQELWIPIRIDNANAAG
ncbi:MAG: hypothetical protein L0Z63_03880 [Actinobacteria bacterium]|nr:hypothetical protein [Actinomycetota bacterium]